jgi:glycosyltransferase involved in cell wall biosynthesis
MYRQVSQATAHRVLSGPYRHYGHMPRSGVSVVVPVYNPGKYLHRCVKSLLGQTMPASQYEVIFVDDGSTDGSAAQLDALAPRHENVRVIHQENSGWPGRPRNVGMAAARGDYLFFCDHDDWLAVSALANLYRHAVEWGSDIVVPKSAGVRRRVPHQLFTRTRPQVSLATAPLMDSLTPHKLFRRAFLEEHQILFPEGKRRLEDHHFVVSAYLQAHIVSVAADQTYYYLLGRRDGGNSSTGAVDWEEYFRSLAEAVEVVERHTDPGPFRDRLLRRWLQTEMCGRLSGRRYLNRSSEDVRELFEHAHAVARDHFGPGVISLMPPLLQPVGQAIIDGDAALVRRQAEAVAAWSIQAEIRQVRWAGKRLQVSGTVGMTDDQPDSSSAALEQRFAELVPDMSRPELLAGLRSTTMAIGLVCDTTGERWTVPTKRHGTGMRADFTAAIDCGQAANGRPLPDGIWELEASVKALGFFERQRFQVVGKPLGTVPSLATRLSGRQLSASVGNHGRLLISIRVAAPSPKTAWTSRIARHLPPPVKRVLRPIWHRVRRLSKPARVERQLLSPRPTS